MADWTAPITWSGALVTVDNLNQQVRDNLAFLKDTPIDVSDIDEVSNYSTSSTTFTDIDGTDLARTIVTYGGDIIVNFVGNIFRAAGNTLTHVFFDIDLDGARVGGDDGIIPADDNGVADTGIPITFQYVIQGVAAGTHTLKLQWKVALGTETCSMYAGAGTSNGDVHPQFAAWER